MSAVTGTCGFCERKGFTLDDLGRLSKHGYRRPGDGFLVGSCPGSHRKCLELSPETLDLFIQIYGDEIKRLERVLKGKPPASFFTKGKAMRDSQGGLVTDRGEITYSMDEVTEKSNPQEYQELVEAWVERIKRNLQGYSAEVKRAEKRRGDWKETPLTSAQDKNSLKEQKLQEQLEKKTEAYKAQLAKDREGFKKLYARLLKEEARLKHLPSNDEDAADVIFEVTNAAHKLLDSFRRKVADAAYRLKVDRWRVYEDLDLPEIIKHFNGDPWEYYAKSERDLTIAPWRQKGLPRSEWVWPAWSGAPKNPY